MTLPVVVHVWPGKGRATYDRHVLQPSGRVTAWLRCPGCGEGGSLEDHTIEFDGMVQPALACPYECGFHEHVKLEQWFVMPPAQVEP